MSLLTLDRVGKSFGPIQALTDVSFQIAPGEVVGLMGDNGAGKSTLVKIIAGNFPPTSGQMHFAGDPVRFTRPIDARTAGIEVVYQDLALADNLSAAANVFLGREMKRRVGPFRLLDHRGMATRATELFRELKSETRAADLVRQMSGGQRQAVAIARTRLAQARLVLMDEPTAAISVRQIAEVLALINRLREAGIAVMLISHRMPDVFEVCERVMVLRRGRKVADKRVAGFIAARGDGVDHRRAGSCMSEFTNVGRAPWHARGFFATQTAYVSRGAAGPGRGNGGGIPCVPDAGQPDQRLHQFLLRCDRFAGFDLGDPDGGHRPVGRLHDGTQRDVDRPAVRVAGWHGGGPRAGTGDGRGGAGGSAGLRPLSAASTGC